MSRVSLMLVLCLVAPLTLAAQQPPAPHDSVRGAIRAVDMRARSLEVTTGVGFALRVVRISVPAGVPITDRRDAQPKLIGLAALKPGDVVRAVFGGKPTGFVAYTIERVGRMESGVETTP
jgi:hypothetical protein